MPLNITVPPTKVFSLHGEDLVHGVVYEGVDGLFYIGVDLKPFPNLKAIGLGNDFYIYTSNDGDEIMFREVTANLTIEP